jgi:hypothetical protein
MTSYGRWRGEGNIALTLAIDPRPRSKSTQLHSSSDFDDDHHVTVLEWTLLPIAPASASFDEAVARNLPTHSDPGSTIYKVSVKCCEKEPWSERWRQPSLSYNDPQSCNCRDGVVRHQKLPPGARMHLTVPRPPWWKTRRVAHAALQVMRSR